MASMAVDVEVKVTDEDRCLDELMRSLDHVEISVALETVNYHIARDPEHRRVSHVIYHFSEKYHSDMEDLRKAIEIGIPQILHTSNSGKTIEWKDNRVGFVVRYYETPLIDVVKKEIQAIDATIKQSKQMYKLFKACFQAKKKLFRG